MWGFRLGGGGSDWAATAGSDWAVGVQIGSGRGSDWVGYGPDPITIATFAGDQESGKTHKSELNPLRPI